MPQTLFEFPDITLDTFKRRMDVEMSHSFLACANVQLTAIFIQQTGLSIDKKYISIGIRIDSERHFIKIDTISRLALFIYVNHSWIDVMIAWQSKSGTIFHPGDEVADCNDIKFWFEDLNPQLVVSQMYPDGKVPFKLKNLSYELVIQHLDIDMRLRLFLRPEKLDVGNEAIAAIDDFIGKANEKSEKNDRKDGVVHNWKRQQAAEVITYEVDMGSTGLVFFKKLLKFLSGLDLFIKVEVG